MKLLLAVGAFLMLTGCATAAKYEESLNTMVGKTEVDLIRAWGAPAQSYETGNSKFLTYESNNRAILPGTPPAYTTTYNGGYSYSTPIGGSSPVSIPMRCSTTFELEGGVVKSWRYEGNSCRSM